MPTTSVELKKRSHNYLTLKGSGSKCCKVCGLIKTPQETAVKLPYCYRAEGSKYNYSQVKRPELITRSYCYPRGMKI